MEPQDGAGGGGDGGGGGGFSHSRLSKNKARFKGPCGSN